MKSFELYLKKILIIKMGYSETLDAETSKIVSLGDVLRCSVILEPLRNTYQGCHITWLVSKEATPLVSHNEYIDKVLVWDEFTPYVLMREKYDIVINLEKINGICALTDMIDAWEKVGFRFNSYTGEFDTYLRSSVAKEYIANKELLRSIWQKIIIEMIGDKWESQEYSLGYKPKTKAIYDVGFNYFVGKKWPTKAMPEEKWKELADRLEKKGVKITWQEGLDNLYDYMEWLASSKVVVSNDSLGFHLALALKRRVVAIFGPTSIDEVYLYDRGECVIPPESFVCQKMPCYLPVCVNDHFCLNAINLDELESKILNQLGLSS